MRYGQRVDPRFLEGIRLFDEGAYFEAHEAWEACWRDAVAADARLLYQGLVQVTAAFHKRFVVGDAASAQRLLARGLAKLEQIDSAQEIGGAPGARPKSIDLDAGRPALRRCLDALARGTLAASDVPRLTAP